MLNNIPRYMNCRCFFREAEEGPNIGRLGVRIPSPPGIVTLPTRRGLSVIELCTSWIWTDR